MSHESQPSDHEQNYEGWRQLTPGRANDYASEVNSPLPNGKTGAEQLDKLYGTGNWVFDDSEFRHERALEHVVLAENNRIAMEGLKNVILANIVSDHSGEARLSVDQTYVSDDGIRLTGKVQNQTASSPLGRILISPDGDRHFQEFQNGKK